MRTHPLRKARKLAGGISRERLAREARISANQVYRIETGRSETTLPTARALVRALNKHLEVRVSVDQLFPDLEEQAS